MIIGYLTWRGHEDFFTIQRINVWATVYRHERYSANSSCNSSSNNSSSNSNSKQVTSQKNKPIKCPGNQIKSKTAAVTTPWAPSCWGLPLSEARRGTRLARICRRPGRTRRGRSPSSQPRAGRKGPERERGICCFIYFFICGGTGA